MNEINTGSIVETFKSQVSKEMTVVTFSYQSAVLENSNINTDDSIEITTKNDEVTKIIQSFLNFDGVIECSFDLATSTFTVVTKTGTSLNQLVQEINKSL